MNEDTVILYAEDEETDAYFIERAFKQADVRQRLVVVRSGQEAIDYLAGKGEYADRARYPLPCLVLLDLNMPGVSGLDVLKWVRATPSVCTLVTIVLTSSNQNVDVHRAYQQGANGYLVKPGDINSIVSMARAIKDYWLTQNRAILPASAEGSGGS
jgi:CheY-like chemotaxis protein